MSRSIIAVAPMSSPKISPHAEKGFVGRDDHRRALIAGGHLVQWAATILAAVIVGVVPTSAVALPPNPPSVGSTRAALGRLTVHSHTTQPAYKRAKLGTT